MQLLAPLGALYKRQKIILGIIIRINNVLWLQKEKSKKYTVPYLTHVEGYDAPPYHADVMSSASYCVLFSSAAA